MMLHTSMPIISAHESAFIYSDNFLVIFRLKNVWFGQKFTI